MSQFFEKASFKSYAVMFEPRCSIVGHLEITYVVLVGFTWIIVRSHAGTSCHASTVYTYIPASLRTKWE